MYTDFDEMDIEPKTEPPPRKSSPFQMDKATKNDKSFDEELQSQLLLRTVPLDDGSIGYVFTCTKNGPLATWRCHACNFVDSWRNLVKHTESGWHQESMSKFQHSRSNFSKVENAIPDISKGQPLPPGMEDIIAGPCQIWKTLENYDHPLIGLEFLLELNMLELKEPRYLCLLCDKRGDPRSILVHLTSQSHYLIYLVSTAVTPLLAEFLNDMKAITAHRKYFKSFYGLIDKLPKSNECRGNVATVTSHLIAKLDEKYGRLQPTATREDVINVPEQRTIILQKIDSGIHFVEAAEDRFLEEMLTIEYVQDTSLLLKNFPLKPKLVDKSKVDENSKSLFHKGKLSSRKQLRHRNPHDHERDNSPDVVFVSSRSSKYEHRGRELSPRSRSHRSSRSPDYGRRRPTPPYYRSSRYRSRSRSPRRHRSRSPYDRYRPRSPHRASHSSRHGHYRHTPERYHRHSPSPSIRDIYASGYRRSGSRSRKSREKSSPHRRSHKSRSPRHARLPADVSKPQGVDGSIQNNKPKDRHIEENRIAFSNELKEVREKLNKEMEHYSETPEKHPAYQEEWKKFWCNRFKELQAEGKIDPHTYDYKPEWISFWNVRVKELFNEELEREKKELRGKYGLSEEDDGVVLPKKANEIAHAGEEGKKPVVDIKAMWKELTGFEIKEEPAKQKAISPWEDNDDDDNPKVVPAKGDQTKEKLNDMIDHDAQPISPEPLSSISDSESRSRSTPRRSYSRSRSVSRSRSRSRSKRRSYSRDRELRDEYHRKPSKKIHFENPLNIITVLRQLSVLEFQLGSYASHVITLLSSGLHMERVKPQSSVDLLTKENVIFLELVKEKLKGQLLAGVVQKSMVKATLFCIKNIEELLLIVPKMKSIAPPPVPAPPPSLLYGAGVDTMTSATSSMGYPHPAPPPPPSHGPMMYHMPPYGMPPGYKPAHPMKMYRYPYRKTSPPKKSDPEGKYHKPVERQPYSSGKTEYPFADDPKDKKEIPVVEEVPIDKVAVAEKIAEVLTAQGRGDVSEEELQTLINTVVENLKKNPANRDPEVLAKSLVALFSKETDSRPVAATPANSTLSPSDNLVTIPAGFDLNNVSSSTLAILQDAYANLSSVNATKTFNIEELPESELIQLLRNFKSIPRFKQEKLIEYLRKLEGTNPEKVEELKKYVNVL